MRYLMREFEQDPTWSKETYQRVARETGLSESQVYKWGWDQKNKKENENDDEKEDNAEAQEEGEDNNNDEFDPKEEAENQEQ